MRNPSAQRSGTLGERNSDYRQALRRHFGLPADGPSSATAARRSTRAARSTLRDRVPAVRSSRVRIRSNAADELRKKFRLEIGASATPNTRSDLPDVSRARPHVNALPRVHRNDGVLAAQKQKKLNEILGPYLGRRSKKGAILGLSKSRSGKNDMGHIILDAQSAQARPAGDGLLRQTKSSARATLNSLSSGLLKRRSGLPLPPTIPIYPPVQTIPVSGARVLTGASIQVPCYYHRSSFYPYLTIGYPYWGYYSIYPRPYLLQYGCDFYSHFYVRFGRCRLSLYSLCDGPLLYHHHHRHYHTFYCPIHGYHYYHLRDCPLCYPDGSTQIIYETLEDESPQAEANVLALTPGELRFCEGWSQLRAGDYDGASETFYNATIEIPDSGLVNLFLSASLAGVEEYVLAGKTLDEAYRLNPTLVSYRWDPEANFGTTERFEALLAQLQKADDVSPSGPPAKMLAMLELLSARTADDLQQVVRLAGQLQMFGDDSAVVGAILAEAQKRVGESAVNTELPAGFDSAVQNWLLAPTCEEIPSLRLGVN